MTTAVDGGVRIESWTPDRRIGEERAAWLSRGLVETMPDLRMRALLELRPGLLTEPQHLVVASDPVADRPLAVLGSCWEVTAAGRSFLHIGVQFVAQRLRGGDIFRRSWIEHLAVVMSDGHFPRLSCLKTFNPVAYCAMRDFGRLPGAVIYPDLEHGPVIADPDLRSAAEAMAAHLASDHEFDRSVGVIRGVGVPRDLYRQRPVSRDDHANAYFERNVGAGDRLLVVVDVRSRETEAAILEHFAARKPRPPSRGLD